jgi:hypothetical protein
MPPHGAGCPWRNGCSRLESRRGADAIVREARGLQAFEGVLRECLDESPMRICAHSLIPNHWHLLEALRRSVLGGRPSGRPEWQNNIAKLPGL